VFRSFEVRTSVLLTAIDRDIAFPSLSSYILTTDAANTLVPTFVSSRLDYCNSLLVGAADCVIRKLQGVQNAAARMITETFKFHHVTPILRELHGLPVAQWIQYKIAMLVNQVVSIIRIETICGPPQLPSFHNSFPVIRTANAKNRRFHVPQPCHFCFPWRRPCDYHAICCMDGKAIQCLPNPSQHVAIYLQ